LDANLTFERVIPSEGTPGVVVEMRPLPGRTAPRGTGITLLVGVEPDRFQEARLQQRLIRAEAGDLAVAYGPLAALIGLRRFLLPAIPTSPPVSPGVEAV